MGRPCAFCLTGWLVVQALPAQSLPDDMEPQRPMLGGEVQREAEAELRELVPQFLQVQERRKTLYDDLNSPNRKLSIEEFRREDERLREEATSLESRMRDAQRRRDTSVVDGVQSRSVVMAGSGAGNAVLERLYPEFLGRLDAPQAGAAPPQLFYEADGIEKGLRKLIAGRAEAAVLNRPLTQAERESLQQAFPDPRRQPEERAFCRAVLVIVVHGSNRLRCLTLSQVKAIYHEKIGNWSAMSSFNRSIVRIGTKYPRLSWWLFNEQVLGGETIDFPNMPRPEPGEPLLWKDLRDWHAENRMRFPGGGPFARYEDDAKVTEEVAKTPGAIGYCILLPTDEEPKGVRIVPISEPEDGAPMAPTRGNIVLGRYPLHITLSFLVSPNASDAGKAFVEFVCSNQAVATIQQCGLYSLVDQEQMLAEQRVEAMKAGKGQPVVVCDLAGVGEAIKAVALEFARAKMAVQVTLDEGGGNAEQACERLKTGKTQLLLVDDGLDETLGGPVIEQAGQEMVLGSRAVGVVVHPENVFHQLTMDDLRQILAGEVDRWPGRTGTAERIVLYGLPANDALMQLVDQAMGPDAKRTKMTVRPNSERVILSVASQPGALGLVDLTKVGRHETKVKLLAILPPGTSEAVPPAPDRVPEGYPLARPVHLHLSPKASEAAQAFFAFLNEGGGREALLGAGLVPRPLPETIETEIAAAYGPAEQPEAALPPAQVAAVVENDSPATAAPDHLHEVLRGALSGPAEGSSARAASVAAQSRADQAAEGAAASTPLDRDRPASRPRPAEAADARQPARGDGSAPHPAASEPSAAAGDFFAWITAHAVPIGLGGMGVVAFAIVLGTFSMKRARHRKEVLRRYRP